MYINANINKLLFHYLLVTLSLILTHIFSINLLIHTQKHYILYILCIIYKVIKTIYIYIYIYKFITVMS